MKKKYMIKNMYMKDNLPVPQIAEKLKVSSQYVLKILKSVEGYKEKREAQKQNNREKHRRSTIEYITEKRQLESQNRKEDVALIANMLRLQSLNAVSMSRKNKLTDRSMVKMNYRYYLLSKDKKKLIFNEDKYGQAPYDLPTPFDVHEREVIYSAKVYESAVDSKL